MIELLSPAGSYEAFKAAIGAGADAVYLGGNRYGARAYANNLTTEELLLAVDYAHLYNRKLYLTVNTLCKEEELTGLFDFLSPLYQAGLDGVIVQDLGVISYIRRCFPEMEVHASTQMTLTGVPGARYLKSLGATRIVPARELSLSEIRAIHEEVDIEIESFIHGAMCYSYSGQCLFSSILGGRSGNRGRCAQPCRLPYDVYDGAKRLNPKGEQFVLSMRDMCTIDLIPKMVEAGIVSLKIEGRMKKPAYTAGVTAIYRKYFDRYQEHGAENFRVDEKDRERLISLYSRSGSGTGYYEEKNGRNMITLGKPGYESQIEEETQSFEKPISIEGDFFCKVSEPVSLTLVYGEHHVTVKGPVTEASMKHPATEEAIEKQLYKTGETFFQFVRLSITMEGECFLPVKVLNDLRRDAITLLQEKLLKENRRGYGEKQDLTFEKSESLKKEVCLSAVIPSTAHGRAILNLSKLEVLYLESDALFGEEAVWQDVSLFAGECKKKDIRLELALPYIFREETRKKFEMLLEKKDFSIFQGYLIRNYEELQWVEEKELHGERVSDFGLYSFNKEARNKLMESGITRDTLPLELNSRECENRGMDGSELMVYGVLPMMISAQCISKTTGNCTKKPHVLTLKDRYQTSFPVQCQCEFCYNIIGNSVPVSLHNEWKLLKRMNPSYLRLHFTTEEVNMASKIGQYFEKALNGDSSMEFPVQNFTKGHFKRGVV